MNIRNTGNKHIEMGWWTTLDIPWITILEYLEMEIIFLAMIQVKIPQILNICILFPSSCLIIDKYDKF